MADKKISQLTAATTPLAGTEVLPIVQGGSTVKVSAADVTTGRAVSAASLTLTGSPLGTASGGTGLASFTSGGVVYASSTSALATGGALKWDGANKLTLFRTTSTEAQEPTVEFSNKVFAGQNPGVVKGANGGLALDIQSPSDSTFQLRSRIYMNGGSGNVISFQTSADNASTWTTNAELTSGNLKFNTAAKGIDFSANTGAAGETSALLNWYEEGTWTPTYEGTTGSAGAVAYAEQAGSYTRIGNRVILTGTIILTNNGDWTGNVRIGGMPFNSSVASGSESMGSVQMRNVTTTGAYVVADFGRTANNKIAFINVNSAGAATNVACADVPDDGAFLFTIVYRVA
jgi:hypothetical protein